MQAHRTSQAGRGLAAALLAVTASCAVSAEPEQPDKVAEAAVLPQAKVIRAERLWYTCHTAAVQGTTTWHYDSSPFNVLYGQRPEVHVSHTTAAGTTTDDGWVRVTYRGQGLFDTGDGKLAMRFVPRVGKGPTADYAPSIRVFHGTISLLASGENGYCTVDDSDEYGTACGNPVEHYSCSRTSCGCLDGGPALPDPVGNALIDAIAGAAAGPIRALIQGGFGALLSLGAAGIGVAGEEILVSEVSATGGSLGKYFASSYLARFNFLIEAELQVVRAPVVSKLLQFGNGAAAGKTVDVIGELGAETVTLGEARAFTQQAGREIGLVYDTTRRRLKLIYGTNQNLGRPLTSSEQLLWHTHPSGLPPSRTDSLWLRTAKYDTSFVIPAAGNSPNQIFQFWAEPPVP